MGATEAIQHPLLPPPSSSSSSSIGEESTSSQGSCSSSSDLVDDASSSSTLSQDSSSFGGEGGGGPLWELSDLITHLPIKRGLSRHYAGKSQSFMSLASARSLEDLAKENPCAKRLKLCTGRGVGFEGRSSPDIRDRGTLESRPSFMATSRPPPPIPVVRTF